MKKLSKIIFILILFSLLLPLFAAFGNNSASADSTVDLTKLQHGHFKVYDWKEGEEKRDITGDVFNGTGGDYIFPVLYDPKNIPIFIEYPGRNVRGRDSSEGAFWFSPWVCNDPGCPGDCEAADLGNMWVISDTGRKMAEKEGGGIKALKKLLHEIDFQNGHPTNKDLVENDCPGMLKHLRKQPTGTYLLAVYGQSGDQVANPMDTFNKFEIAPPLTIDLQDPNNPKITGPGPPESDGGAVTLKEGITGENSVFWNICQDAKNENNPRDIIYYVYAGKGGGLDAVMRWILNIVKTVIDKIISAISRVVEIYAIIDTKDFFSGTFLELWRNLRDICNILFVLVLLGIAFMNFFGEGIDAYTIKKLLPRFLIAIIIINFSLIMCKIIVDFSNVLSQTFASIGDYKAIVTEQTSSVSGGIASAEFGAAIVALILAIIGAIAGLLLAFLLIFRVIMIWLLVMISPFVFLLWVLPPTQPLFSKWWDNFIKYVFMGPVVVLILALAKRVSGSINSGSDAEAANWIKLLFSSGMIIAAAAVPLALGGMAMQKVSGAIRGVSKRAGGMAWGATGAKAVARGKEGLMARMAEKRGIGRIIPQTKRGRAKREAEVAKVREPIYDNMDDEKLAKLANNKNDVMAAKALIRHGHTDKLDSKMIAKSPALQQMAKQYDPVSAGLTGTDLQKHLDSSEFDAGRLTAAGVNNILKEGGELSDHHIQAIATRGNQSAINSLHSHYAEHPNQMPAADSSAGKAILHSALASKSSKEGAHLVQSMQKSGNLGSYLQHASANQAVEWQNSGVFDKLVEQKDSESLNTIGGWARGNADALSTLKDKGEISEDFFSKLAATSAAYKPGGPTS